MDLPSAESKATYEDAQEWVQKKNGSHVTYLNIAQVKRKQGITERDNYNKPKYPDSKQPGCPEEKTRAIEAALKHFQMICKDCFGGIEKPMFFDSLLISSEFRV